MISLSNTSKAILITCRFWGLILLTTAACVSTAKAVGIGHISTVPMEKGFRVREAVLADFDADGARDLLVACSDNRHEDRRQLRIHYGSAEGVSFTADPGIIYEVTPDVIAFSTGEFISPAGADIVLFTVSGAYAWAPVAGRRTRPVPLLDCDLLWQLPDPERLFYWEEGGADWNGDGLSDLMIPEPTGFRLALQSSTGADGNAVFLEPVVLRLPRDRETDLSTSQQARRLEVRNRARQLSVSLSIGDVDPKYQATNLSVRESIPAPIPAHWDGDAVPEILALDLDELMAWKLASSEEPAFRMEFPVTLDAARFLDVSFSVHSADLNRDNKADCVILAGDRNSTEARTQVLVYVQGMGRGDSAQTPEEPLFGPRGIPQQLLLIGGFAGMPQLEDLNGDGLPDLFLSRVQLTSMEALRAATSGLINADLLVYLNQGGKFSTRPDATMTVALPTEGFSSGDTGVLARFIGDVTGNGMQDLLVRDKPDRLRLFAFGKTRNGLAWASRPVFETSIVQHARVLFPSVSPPELLVLEGNKTVHVSF
jgi:hypothetical protein